MKGLKAATKPPSGGPGRIFKAVLQFYLRDRAPVARPPTSVRDAAPLPLDGKRSKERKQSFSGELFAELLLELPMHRDRLARAGEDSDFDTLGNAIHQLLGAVAYCDAPELEDVLRELRLAIKTGERHAIDRCLERVINVIDSTLRYSGYPGDGASGQV